MDLKTPDIRYTLGLALCLLLYVMALWTSISLIVSRHPSGALLYGLAVLPALPIGGTIHVFLKYIDAVDEYVRGILLKRFVLATGLTLFLATAWGFIEENAGGPHMSLYLTYPLLWVMFALSGSIYRKVP